MIDVKTQLNAVERQLGERVYSAREVRTVTVSQTYDRTTLEDLWDACTNPERIPRWFLPVSGELRLGGRYQLEGNAGGTIESCDPPRGFTATWEFAGGLSWIEVRVTAAGDDSARLELEHLFPMEEDSHWREFGPGAVGVGWDMAFLGLAMYLATGQGMDPQEAATWTASDEGRWFMSTSSDLWCDASIAAGVDETQARAAAARTRAAYTGASPE